MEQPILDPYRELFERSTDAILIIEGETFVDCNQATVEMLRYSSRDELLSTHPSELSPPTQPDGRESYEKANEMIAVAFEHGSHRFEWDHVRADGEVFPVEVLLTAVQREDQRILHVVWRDITERKQLENQLRHTQKMEAIGLLAGGIAHDFNNLLVAIIGNADLLQALVDDESLSGPIQDILKAGERAAVLVRQLLAFSRKQEPNPRVIDLNEVISDVERLLRRLIGEHVSLVTVNTDAPLLVKADPNQIELVMINLATNARDAMPDGGALTLELRRETVMNGNLEGESLASGDYAVLAAIDTGRGVDEDTAACMFDPFFTTKEFGKGTGLGLSTVYGIARQNGGTVKVFSVPGEGTTMKVYLPVSLGVAAGRAAEPVSTPSGAGSETILVAEDEVAVSTLVANALRAKGYRVILAENGRQAFALWKRHKDSIDLILTDVVMPVMGGPELVRRLRELGHDPPVLFMSGYTHNAMNELENAEETVDLLEKPFSAHELVERVRKALDRKA